jgi:release factor glutamine methyltransferase
MNEITIADLKKELIQRSAGKVEQPAEMLLVLLSHILGRDKTWVLAHPDQPIAENSQHALEAAWSRLSDGEPLAYITGTQAFFGLDFIVTPHVLIPRPETEILVETSILWLSEHPNARKAVDIGTGSGCIAVSLAKTFDDLQILATDISPDALHVAHQNALRHETCLPGSMKASTWCVPTCHISHPASCPKSTALPLSPIWHWMAAILVFITFQSYLNSCLQS